MVTLSDLPNLADFQQPSSSNPTRLIKALNQIESASTRQESDDAHHALLFATGNNHEGSYYPVILIVLPLLEKMLQDGSEWAQVTILEVLTDLCGSFHSDVGFEFFQLPMTGTLESLEIMLKKSVSLLIPVAQSIAEGDHNLTSQPAHEVLGSEVQ